MADSGVERLADSVADIAADNVAYRIADSVVDSVEDSVAYKAVESIVDSVADTGLACVLKRSSIMRYVSPRCLLPAWYHRTRLSTAPRVGLYVVPAYPHQYGAAPVPKCVGEYSRG
eukprot:3819414-Rhodomonas_salina.1